MKKAIAAIPGLILGAIYSMPTLLWGLLGLQVVDFATGFLVAWSTGAVSSDVSRKGFVKKTVALLLIVALQIAESVHPMPVELSAYVAGWFCLTELISIVENCGKAGLPLPSKLTKVLAQLQDDATK